MAVQGTDLLMVERGGTLYKATAQEVADLGGGGGLPSLGLWDFWAFNRFGDNASDTGVWRVTAIASGSASTGLGGTTGYSVMGILNRSSATANSGLRYTTSINNTVLGFMPWKFRCQMMLRGALDNCIHRVGFHDTVDHNAPVDGTYFEIINGTCSLKTSSNSVRTTGVSTFTPTPNVPLTLDIDVSTDATEVRFRLYEAMNETPVFDETMTDTIPFNRTLGCGLVTTHSGTTAKDLCALFSLGFGTFPAYQRATGRT